MPNETKLPKLYSELLRLAVWDAVAIEQTPGYVLDMSVWHAPDEAVCRVCMAGAVMANTLSVPPNTERAASDMGADTHRALEAVNDMRRGAVPDVVDDGRDEQVFRLAMRPIRRAFDAFREAHPTTTRHRTRYLDRAPWPVYLEAADNLQKAGF